MLPVNIPLFLFMSMVFVPRFISMPLINSAEDFRVYRNRHRNIPKEKNTVDNYFGSMGNFVGKRPNDI